MAVTMTYTSLVADTTLYLERSDAQTINQIPSFINLCESIISDELKILGQQQTVTTTLVQGNVTLQKPARWRKTTSMNVTVAGERLPLLLRKYEYMRNYWPDPTVESIPKYYGDYDFDHWFIAPTPDDNYAIEILYYEKIQPLDATNQTNWFTINAPQAMLYGTLLQAMPFLKNDSRVQLWQAMYDRAIQTLKLENDTRTIDRSTTVQEV
ncbi:MAG: hypothetical protein EBR82_40610 [Caulobacteraceae bacterium]|jgi:hypothetical protein|nr:hypothetical protein [Caulobacteraceae bacterium]NDD73117.1 hypothetical protein [Actinomycetota bacterium]